MYSSANIDYIIGGRAGTPIAYQL